MLLASARTNASSKLYIDDLFSVYLRTGTGADVTTTTGIDMTKGYMLWSKGRSGATDHAVYDSERGATYDLVTNSTAAQTTQTTGLKSVSSTGHTIGSLAKMNTSSATYVDFVFRKAPKFFDVVTWTATNAGKVYHSLGSLPGFILWKSTSNTGDWFVLARNSDTRYSGLKLNSTAAEGLYGSPTDLEITSTYFTPDASWGATAGQTFVAYFFAHDAGGFGDDGEQNVISCGSYAGTGSSTVSISLGYEPQWVLIKKFSGSTFTDGSASWCIFDNMRGIPTGGSDACLYANLSGAENSEGAGNFINVTATGFEVPPTGNLTNQSACSYIYIAIRRGPMKTPTSGTSVFAPVARAGTSGTATVTAGFPVDTAIIQDRPNAYVACWFDRLRGAPKILFSQTTGAESGSYPNSLTGFDVQTGVTLSYDSYVNGIADTYANWFFRRAPGFFDVVCYTGTGSARTVAHNLGVAPELMIVKSRNNALDWYVYHADIGNTKYIRLNIVNGAQTSVEPWNNTTPTASVFTTGIGYTNESGYTYVAYLFASCPGVSKVGSYTGTGTTQQINCGFTAGARFVLIKRADSTGNWYVWDSARGIVAGNDPHLSLNTTAAEVTTDDSVDPDASGFIVNQVAATNINVNGASYIFLSIS